MNTAIGASQDTLSPSHPLDSGLKDAATSGSWPGDTVWLMTPELQELVECDPDMIRELFSLFLEDSAARLQILGGACNDGNFRIVRAQAHSLKGSSLQMGAARLGALYAALELSNRPEPEMCRPTMREMMHSSEDEFILVRRAIERYLDAQGGLK